jgi:anti-sigma factor RsiW
VEHAQATELFSAYWDHDLGPEDSARLEEHLGACGACRREYEAFEAMLGGLSSLERQAAPAGFVQGVTQRVRRRSRGRFFNPLAAVRRADRIQYELFSVVMLAILVGIYVVMAVAQPGRLHLP